MQPRTQSAMQAAVRSNTTITSTPHTGGGVFTPLKLLWHLGKGSAERLWQHCWSVSHQWKPGAAFTAGKRAQGTATGAG